MTVSPAECVFSFTLPPSLSRVLSVLACIFDSAPPARKTKPGHLKLGGRRIGLESTFWRKKEPKGGCPPSTNCPATPGFFVLDAVAPPHPHPLPPGERDNLRGG